MRPNGRAAALRVISLCLVATLRTTWCVDYGIPVEIQLWDQGRTPLAHMVDVTNEFGLKILASHNFLNENNIAFSPYGLTGILVALYEGVDGESSYQIQRGMQMPWNRNVMRVGFRDIHRTLKTYFIPEEGFLAGLALNNDNVTFNENYKKILKFYGFDLDNDRNSTTMTPDVNSTTENTSTSMPSDLPESTTAATITSESPTKEETTANPNSEIETDIDVRIPTTTEVTTKADTTILPTTTPEITTTGDLESRTTSTEAESTTTNRPTENLSKLESTTVMSTITNVPEENSTTTTPTVTAPLDTTDTADLSNNTSTETTNSKSILTTTTTETTTTPLSSTTYGTRIRESTTDMTTETTSDEEEDDEDDDDDGLVDSTENNTSTTTDKASVTLHRQKKSIVDFIFTSPPYVDDYLIYRSYEIPPDQTNSPLPNNDKMFLVNGLKSVEVSYMHYDTIMKHAYLPHLEATALRLPLDSDRYYLLVILPNRAGYTELGRLIARMARESDLRDVYSALRPRRVRAMVPSFRVKGHVTLTTDLQKLGIQDVFEPRQRDFTPMTSQGNVYVRSIEQAVSVAIRKYRPDDHKRNRYVANRLPVHFSATYPFIYFVMDASINVSLMAGKMVDPLNSRIL